MDFDIKLLIKKAKNRDPEAFTKLIDMHMQGMYKTARAILQNDEDAADAIQDTILACWEKMSNLNEERFFKTWLTRILINNCYGMIRRKKETTLIEDVFEEYADEQNYDLEWKEALDILSDDCRLIVVLFYSQGFHTNEIAKMLGMTDAAVRTKLSRARSRLKKYYREEA